MYFQLCLPNASNDFEHISESLIHLSCNKSLIIAFISLVVMLAYRTDSNLKGNKGKDVR